MGRARRKRKARIVYIKFVLFILLVILAANLIKNTIARYRSSAQSTANVDLAFYLFHEESISQALQLDSILPRANPYEYTFSVANNDGTRRTETAITYTIQLKTTTNLPLIIRVFNQAQPTVNLVSGEETIPDDNGTYFKYITVTGGNLGFLQDEQVNYTLEIEFPERYHVAEYEGIIEYVEVTIRSSQRIQ